MITRDEILSKLKQGHNIKMSPRSFDYYRYEGLIPSIQGRKQRKGLYPDYTPELIVEIKARQKDGWKLSEIKDICDAIIKSKAIEEEITELKIKAEFFKVWDNPEVREQKIVSFLGLKDKGQKYDSVFIPFTEEEAIICLGSFYTDYIDFYKINVGLNQPGNEKLLEKKRLKYNEYMAIVRALVAPITKNNSVLDKLDIFLAIFA